MAMLPLQLWKDVSFLMVSMVDGAIVDRNPETGLGKGGLFIAMGPRLVPRIMEISILPLEEGHGLSLIIQCPVSL